jgi:hypothetical protein
MRRWARSPRAAYHRHDASPSDIDVSYSPTCLGYGRRSHKNCRAASLKHDCARLLGPLSWVAWLPRPQVRWQDAISSETGKGARRNISHDFREHYSAFGKSTQRRGRSEIWGYGRVKRASDALVFLRNHGWRYADAHPFCPPNDFLSVHYCPEKSPLNSIENRLATDCRATKSQIRVRFPVGADLIPPYSARLSCRLYPALPDLIRSLRIISRLMFCASILLQAIRTTLLAVPRCSPTVIH